MKYIFRGNVVFEYLIAEKRIVQHKIHNTISAFDYCHFISEDFKLLSEFFDKAYKHTQGEINPDKLEDIEVY